jgi:hypothetical protein
LSIGWTRQAEKSHSDIGVILPWRHSLSSPSRWFQAKGLFLPGSNIALFR